MQKWRSVDLFSTAKDGEEVVVLAAECDEVVIAVAESLSTPSKSSVVRLQSKLSKFSSGGSKTGGWMKSYYKWQVRIAEVAIKHIDKIGTRYPCSIEQWRECNASAFICKKPFITFFMTLRIIWQSILWNGHVSVGQLQNYSP